LILSIFVIVILVFLIYSYDSQLKAEQDKVASADDKLKTAQSAVKAERKKLREVNEIVHGSPEPVDISLIRNNILTPAAENVKEILKQETYGSEEFRTALHKTGRIEERKYTALKPVYQDLERIIAATIPEIPELNKLRISRDEADQKWAKALESHRDEVSGIEAQVETLRQKNGRLENEKIEYAKEKENEIRRLLDEKDSIQQETEKIREDAFIAEAKLQSQISLLEERIRQMNEKEMRSLEDTDADGEIVHANQGLGMAWIDLGRKHRLGRGLTFEVFQYIKGGKRKKKGMIEVKRVEGETSECAILEQYDRADPIIKGDHIASPFFDKKKEMVFVFVGESLTNNRYERQQLERRIRDFGGRVDDEITIDSDFVIAIKNAEQSPEFAKAVQFGVVIMRESDLLEFIGQ
jgi:hypothetical protein